MMDLDIRAYQDGAYDALKMMQELFKDKESIADAMYVLDKTIKNMEEMSTRKLGIKSYG